MDIKNITDPSFLKTMSNSELNKLSKEIRGFLIDSVSKTGGHLSSNLGIVELTIALHKEFESPKDKIIFDVGHQGYVHKILTGRASRFDTLRKIDGLSGFLKRRESIHDVFESGHSSNSISAAAGFAVSRDLKNEKHHVLAVIGDSSLQSGMALEAINHLGDIDNKVIIILNDNGMSISKNVGIISKFMNRAKISPHYRRTKKVIKTVTPNFAQAGLTKVKDSVKNRVKLPNIFENMNLDYIGPVNGHDFGSLAKALKVAKDKNSSVIVHVKTKKGKGYKFAENDTVGKWHGTGKFDVKTGMPLNQSDICWSKYMANLLQNEMIKDKNIAVITPAMSAGSKLDDIFKLYPERSFDPGIAEGHSMTFASGLALTGMKPYFSIYSSFFNRACDQFVQDVARMNLNVTIYMDRSGIVGEDGATHNGIYDTSILFSTPNTFIGCPSNKENAKAIFDYFKTLESPKVIRIPRGSIKSSKSVYNIEKDKYWFDEIVSQSHNTIVAHGPIVEDLRELILEEKLNINLVNALMIKPYDIEKLNNIISESENIFFVEHLTAPASLYTYLKAHVDFKGCNTHSFSLSDQFVHHGKTEDVLKSLELDALSIIEKIKKWK